jgi:hypothetical protein
MDLELLFDLRAFVLNCFCLAEAVQSDVAAGFTECTRYSEADTAGRPCYNGGFSIQHFTMNPVGPTPSWQRSRQDVVAALIYVNG